MCGFFLFLRIFNLSLFELEVGFCMGLWRIFLVLRVYQFQKVQLLFLMIQKIFEVYLYIKQLCGDRFEKVGRVYNIIVKFLIGFIF